MTSKRIVLCADDYGQNPAISESILSLSGARRLSATSCMTAAKTWPAAARRLRDDDPDIDIGLHFTLVEEPYLDIQALTSKGRSFASLCELIYAAYLRRLDKAAVIRALNFQINLFQEHLGRLPDFIDGHQHIHQLPIVRDALLEVCSMRMSDHSFYIRSLAHISARMPAVFKSLIIQTLGSQQLARGLRKFGISHNPDFAGIHNFTRIDYRAAMRYWLGKARDGAIIMCHPAGGGENSIDSIRNSREIEFAYFNSDAFVEDYGKLNIKLVRGREAGWT